MTKWMLGFSTSGTAASVALMEDGALKAEYALNNTKTHSETILPLCDRLLCDLGLSPKDIAAIAVDVGPGSFTGVRIGVCAANAMAQALDIPVIGVDALRMLYEGVRMTDRCVCSILDARNANVYAALYRDGSCLREPVAATLADWLDRLPADTLFVGDGALAYRETILQALPNAVFAPVSRCDCRAGALLDVAWAHFESSCEEEGRREAVPLYLRASQAERLWAQRSGMEA